MSRASALARGPGPRVSLYVRLRHGSPLARGRSWVGRARISRFGFQTARFFLIPPARLSGGNDKVAHAKSPVFFAAPGRPSSFPAVRGLPFPAKNEGMERRAAHQSFVLAASSFGGCGRLSALHRGVLLRPGRAFWRALPPAVSELLAAGHSARGRSPGAARELGGCVRPPPAGAAPPPARTTPPERPLAEETMGNIILFAGMSSGYRN